MNVKTIMLSDRNQTKRNTCCMTHVTLQKIQTIVTEMVAENGTSEGWEGRITTYLRVMVAHVHYLDCGDSFKSGYIC